MWGNYKFLVFYFFGINVIYKIKLIFWPSTSCNYTQFVLLESFHKIQFVVLLKLAGNSVKSSISRNTYGIIANGFQKCFGTFILRKDVMKTKKCLTHELSVGLKENLTIPEQCRN